MDRSVRSWRIPDRFQPMAKTSPFTGMLEAKCRALPLHLAHRSRRAGRADQAVERRNGTNIQVFHALPVCQRALGTARRRRSTYAASVTGTLGNQGIGTSSARRALCLRAAIRRPSIQKQLPAQAVPLTHRVAVPGARPAQGSIGSDAVENERAAERWAAASRR